MVSGPDLALLCAAAFIGGFFGRVSKVPGGALLGATITVAAAGLYWDMPHTPPYSMILIMQALTGCMLGQSINRRFWHDFLQISRPTLAVIMVFTFLAVPFTFFLVLWGGFEPVTAVLAATPARMQDMIVLAGTAGSDAVTVMLMQLARQFSIIFLTPLMLAKYVNEDKKSSGPGKKTARGHTALFSQTDAASYAILLVPSTVGACIGFFTGHMLGPLLGAFFAVACSRLIWVRAGEVPFPKPFGFLIQCLAGILLGTRITPETAGLLVERLLPLLSACVYVLAGGLIITQLLHKRYGWHKALSWMAAAPGRASDMLAMSQDIDLSGRERLALVSVHTVRQVYFTLFVSVVMVFF
ncbi:MAG: hypothetical protein DELT_00614 [Desulfovibrio sp.]